MISLSNRVVAIARTAALLALATGTLSVTAVAAPSGTESPALVIDRFIAALREGYIFPQKVTAVERELNDRRRAGAYDALSNGPDLARVLTADTLTVLHDKHVRVRYSASVLPPPDAGATPSPDELRQFQRDEAYENYGFYQVTRLRGNIGYIDLREFSAASLAAPTITAAMQFVAHTSGLIIDLRRNRGGDPETVSLLCSYFFSTDGDRVHVNDLALREGSGERIEQFWTSRVPGPYYIDRPIYLLTSSHTFSGGEEFAYDLQNLHRATLVGEVTGGGANPGDVVRLTDHFNAFIPGGRAISPITHKNWEGTGVKPDVAAPATDAAKVAYLTLLSAARAAATDADQRTGFAELIKAVEALPPDRALLDPFAPQ